ncbi:MAG: ABC transporter ATP-binding protein [Spirochaetales bacterium]|nr:ABC transporter ATP-binding protein [Spirochaetales bacterium]
MIQITNLSFGYRKKKRLFSQLNCNLAAGNIYGLLGKNGAGKTTLLKIVCGTLFPHNGECRVMGYMSKDRNPVLLSDIYFITEEFFTPNLTVGEYIFLYGPFYPRFSRNELEGYLQEFAISEKDTLTGLSYGQRKKFLIAFGLATNCRLFIMDEPTNGLDIPSKSQFRKLLVSNVTDDRIFLVSTHQARDMQQLIDPILILDDGEIIFHQSMEEVNDRLTVKLLPDTPGPGQCIFYEKVIGGYAALCDDTVNGVSSVDLEILFNAVISDRERMNAIFMKKEKQPEEKNENHRFF